jgi:hypothetical protein
MMRLTGRNLPVKAAGSAELLGHVQQSAAAAGRAGASLAGSFYRIAASFPAMLAFGLAMVTFVTCRGRFHDPDTWLHLKLGETIWNSRSIPRTDIFSYTASGHAWVAHEWLSELLIYGAYRLGGYSGMMLWFCLSASLIFVLLYVLCSLYSGNVKLSLLGGLIGWFFGTIGLTIRPQILGYLFLVLELLVLQFGRGRGRRWFWLLPPLFALWVNCHGSYLLGIVVLGICTLTSFVDVQAGGLVSVARDPGERRLLSGVLVCCIAALAVNPVGPRLLAYPLNVFTKQGVSLANITEWQPLTVTDERGAGLFAIAGILALIVLVRRVELRLDEVLLLAIAFWMALNHVRLVFAFGILAAPIVCRLLAGTWDRYHPDRDHRAANAFFIALFAAIMIAAFPSAENLEQQVRKSNPAGAVNFIRRAALSGPMLNEYIFGGYLMWALPEQKVFIDGRGDIFDWTGVLADYGRWFTVQEDPSIVLNKYGVHYCLLRKDAPMAFVLPYMPGWQRVYADENSVIFARARPPAVPLPDTPAVR